jgi:hypothetical protein
MLRAPFRLLALTAATIFALTGTVGAAPITCIETFTGSGSLNGQTFTSVLVTLTQTGDTTNVHSVGPGLIGFDDTTAGFSVAGTGSGTFSNLTNTFVNQNQDVGGTGNGTVATNSFVIGGTSGVSAFAIYDLQSSFGPVSGTGFGNAGPIYATSAGSLTFSAISGTGTFQAIVPEPAPVGIVASAALVLATLRANQSRVRRLVGAR